MLKKISEIKDAKNLSKGSQKQINGGRRIPWPIEPIGCGGDGSFIYVNGEKVCCWVPAQQWYIC